MKNGPLQFEKRKKWTANGTSRTIPVKETLKKVIPLANEIGITRLADITEMDRLYIPNFSAVLPGTEDYIWVYSGKGPTKDHAKASALMESIERYCALPSTNPQHYVTGSFNEISKSAEALHPDEVIEPLRFEYHNRMIMDFLSAYDISNDKEILVPAAISQFRYSPVQPSINPFAFVHTNGLASGNVIEEAVCHAICELIERDALSLAELRASALPFHTLRHITNSLHLAGFSVRPLNSNDFCDDPSIFPDVDISDIDFEPVKKLKMKFERENIPLIIKEITSDIKIPVFIASSVEWITNDYGYLAEGHGAHPDSRIALMRAITEVAQTRAANIQGARDDLRKIKYGGDNSDDKRSWQFMKSSTSKKFSEIISFENEDILEDIKLLINKLRLSGLSRVIVVNLTNPKINIPVVRAIVPGLETFKITKSIMGPRARSFLKK